MTRTSPTFLCLTATLLLALPTAASVDDYPGQAADEAERAGAHAWNAIDDVRLATARYHDLAVAIDDGFVPFALDGGKIPTCFDGPEGGMGVHYVRGVDDSLDASKPEAMVYELTPDGRHRLVAVEYVVPEEFVEDDQGKVVSRPLVLGRPLHKHASLPLFVLHAWIWRENPGGMFGDLNRNVAACPSWTANVPS